MTGGEHAVSGTCSTYCEFNCICEDQDVLDMVNMNPISAFHAGPCSQDRAGKLSQMTGKASLIVKTLSPSFMLMVIWW